MYTFPLQIRPDVAAREMMEYATKSLQSAQTIGLIREEDIQYGESEREAVFSEDKMTLYRFTPLLDEADLHPIPLVINYAFVNRPYMADLQENRSLVRNLLNLGLDVYLIDYGYPGREDRWLTLDDYINGYLNDCVDYLRERYALDAINLLGICQGGTLSLCYTSIYPEKIANLITMVTPVDFYAEEGLLNMWTGCQVGSESVDPELMVEALGNIPGDLMNLGYLMLKPFQLNVQKYQSLTNIADDRQRTADFLRMEKWIFDSPDQAGEAWKQFVQDFYQGNKLIKGEVMIGDKRVDLHNVTMPVLNVYAEQDHLVPPQSSMALKQYIGTDDYTVEAFPVGHIGMYVSGRVQKSLPPLIAEWVKARG